MRRLKPLESSDLKTILTEIHTAKDKMNSSEGDVCSQPAANLQFALKKPHKTILEPSSSINHSFPHINEGIGSLWALEKCNKRGFLWMQPSVELLKELPVNKTEENKSPHALPTLPRISLSSLFSSIFFPCYSTLSVSDLWLPTFFLSASSSSLCQNSSVVSLPPLLLKHPVELLFPHIC